MKLNKIDDIWKSANLLFKWIFALLSSKNFATMATWRNDFSSLLSEVHKRCSQFNIKYVHLELLIKKPGFKSFPSYIKTLQLMSL